MKTTESSKTTSTKLNLSVKPAATTDQKFVTPGMMYNKA